MRATTQVSQLTEVALIRAHCIASAGRLQTGVTEGRFIHCSSLAGLREGALRDEVRPSLVGARRLDGGSFQF